MINPLTLSGLAIGIVAAVYAFAGGSAAVNLCAVVGFLGAGVGVVTGMGKASHNTRQP